MFTIFPLLLATRSVATSFATAEPEANVRVRGDASDGAGGNCSDADDNCGSIRFSSAVFFAAKPLNSAAARRM